MVKITEVCHGSLADRHGIKAGDTLLSIDGNDINDVLDYRFYLTEKRIALRLSRNGEEYSVEIRKGEYDDIGLEFATPLMDEKHSCKNGCIFCFIDQNPRGMRDTIYFKDDDSRLSFIHGNYVTLTNMTDSEVARIIKMRISPINISVHTTNPELRVKMMKNKRAGEVLRYLSDFKAAGLSMCGQIVLCRGVNDGTELERTLTDLAEYYPEMGSVAVVPAGLTKHRDRLYPLSDFTPEEAREVIATVDRLAEEQLSRHGSRIFFVADEMYLKAGLPIPPAEYYEDYPQLDNGVGLLRSFADEFDIGVEDVEELRSALTSPRHVTVATGAAAYEAIKSLSDRAMALCPGLTVSVVKIRNDYFGESVTVSGLLTGCDMLAQLKDRELGDELLISASCLRQEEDDFLCGMTRGELSDALSVPIRAVESDGFDFLDALLGR